MPDEDDLVVSLSSENTFLQCQMSYFWRYIRGLQPTLRDVAPEKGSIFHDKYFDTYYRQLKAGMYPTDAHTLAIAAVESARVMNDQYASIAEMAGLHAVAIEFSELTNVVLGICERYYEQHGRDDAEEFEVLLVEQPLDVKLSMRGLPADRRRIRSVGKVDLVTRHRDHGRVSIWEHKSTIHVPPDGVRLHDLQTFLYDAKLMAMKKRGDPELVVALAGVDHIDSVMWNYVRTKIPTVPHELKKGGISLDKSIDTTWEVYAAAVMACGNEEPYDPKYAEMRRILEPREQKVFFPRYEKVGVLTQRILRSYVATAHRISDTIERWGRGDEVEMTISKNCIYCNFHALCDAELTGGDVESAIRLRYRYRARGHELETEKEPETADV